MEIQMYKICDSTRSRRYVVPALPTVASLLELGSSILGKTVTRIVTEHDGCQITFDLVLNVFQNNLLMLLDTDESWVALDTQDPSYDVAGDNLVEPEGGSSANLSSSKLQINDSFLHQDLPSMVAVSVTSEAQLPSSGEDVTDSAQQYASSYSGQTAASADDGDENSDPNGSPNGSHSQNGVKRPSDNVTLQKSSKKHASSELKFQCFAVNWSKVSDNVLDQLQKQMDFRNENANKVIPSSMLLSRCQMNDLVKSVVDQLRTIDKHIQADVMEAVARQILLKYPCLNFADDDGYKKANGHVTLKYKMISRNSYLNRYKEEHAPRKESLVEIRRNRNLRSGTLKEYWEYTSDNCSKDIWSKLIRDEPELLTNDFLEASQPYIRYRFDEDKPLKDVLACLPVLRRRSLLLFHFERATGMPAKSLEDYFNAKRMKIIDFAIVNCKANQKIKQLGMKSSDSEIFEYLCSKLGENFNDVIIHKEIGTKTDTINTQCAGPVIVAIDLGNNDLMYYVYAEQVRLSEGTKCVITAMTDLLCVHYVHNFMYMKEISKFLEFVQQYFLKILPAYGSKSNATKKGKQQRVVNRLIEDVSLHEMSSHLTDVL